MANPFDDLIPQAAAPKRGLFDDLLPKAQGRSDALAGAIGQGALMNFGDEATAAVRATLPEFSDWMMQKRAPFGESEAPVSQETSKAGSWQERYDAELAKTRGQMKADAAAYPTMTTLGEIGGNVATAALALPAAATATAPTLLGNIVKGAAVGGGLGGAAGFGAGEGGAANRAVPAVMGGVLGAAGGAAVPVLGLAGRAAMETAPGRYVSEKVVSPSARALATLLEGPQPLRSLSAAAPDGTPGASGLFTQIADETRNQARTGAMDRLATALQRAKINPTQVSRRLDELGPEAMLADIDPQLLSAARMANTMPGETRSIAKIRLEGRDRGAGPRLVQAFEGTEPPPSSYALRGEGQAFDQNLRAVGNHAYGMMRDAGIRQSPELMEIQSNPIVSRAIDSVMNIERQTRQGTNRPPASPIEIMHKVKQTIWDMGFDAATARPGPNASYYRDLGIQYMDRLKAANPMLAAADQRYAQAASLPEHFDLGRSLLSRGSSEKATEASAPALADLLSRADPQQRLAARAGATNAARETALEGTRPARALAQRVHESAPVRDKLVELYGPERAAQIMRQAEAEGVFAGTSNDILRGSKTADKLAEVLDAGGTQLRASSSGLTARVLERLDAVVNRLAGPNEAVRNAIGHATLNTDATANKELLAAIADILAKRARGNPGQLGLASSAASNFGSNP